MNNKKAILSVWDKTGIVELARFLHSQDFEIISTGGTAREIKKANIPVTKVSKITNQHEIMDGRVKTLHPNIFGGILADRENSKHMEDLLSVDSLLIDLVVINLYPFKEQAVNKKLDLEKSIEYIDIGGPSMLRAAAKNSKYVIPLCNPLQYKDFIELYKKNKGTFTDGDRLDYARQVFSLTSSYDAMISNYFNKGSEEELNLSYIKNTSLRYGENPHQKSHFYLEKNKKLLWEQLNGKELSYNNYFDIESAINIVFEFDECVCSIIKHSNPCGFGIGKDNIEAYKNAVSTDPVSYFGGIVGFNNKVDKNVAIEINKSFLECIVAPSFSKDAVNILSKKKNLRLIKINKEDYQINSNKNMFRTVFNGVLMQEKDQYIKDFNNFTVVTKRKPNKNEYNSLLLGWKLVKFVKSNAIVFSNDEKLLGVGAGQMSRVDSVKIAIEKASNAKLSLKEAIMASDAFFPFADSIELAVKSGISGIIQPGGSLKDQEVIDVANKLNIFMVFTNERHFYH